MMLNLFRRSLSLNNKPSHGAVKEIDLYTEYIGSGGNQSDIGTYHALEVTDFSSQYGSETSISYTAKNLAGRGSIFPSYGDFTQACVFRTYGPWWEMAPSRRDPFLRTPPWFCSQDYIELSFERKVYPLKLEIYETYHPGCVVRILACDRDTESDVDAGHIRNRWKTLWEGEPSVTHNSEARCFSPKLRRCPFPTDLIRLELCHKYVHYYTELDSVLLYGYSKKSSWNTSDCDIDGVEDESFNCDINNIQNDIRNLTLHDTHSQQDKSCIAHTKNDKPCVEGLSHMTKPYDHGDGHVTQDLENGEVNRTVIRQESEDCIPSDNGYFDLLPEEVIQLILSFLDLLSLCRVARTCSLFHKHSYDALQYKELNLQPHWTQVTNLALDSLHSRSRHLQRLNLSWCHGNIVSHNGFSRLIEVCGKNLTCLYLSSCSFVRSESIEVIAEYCRNLRELDLDSCKNIDHSGFMPLMRLTQLQRLNLYRTNIDDIRILPIVRSCPHLKHMNLGSCNCINQYDDVCIELATNCQNLVSLDLWNSEKVTHTGIKALAVNCKELQEVDIGWWGLKSLDLWRSRTVSHIAIKALTCCSELEEIDIGWCPEVKSPTNCIVELVKECRKLKKLYLTANRTICDKDLLAVSKYSLDLEQLDILGTRQVTAEVAQKVLENCKKLKFFDVSFCSDIDNYIVGTWKSLYPNVDIKKSFQN